MQGVATLTGLLLVGGIEYAFAPNWSAKLEYDHAGYLSRNVDLGANGSTNQSVTTNTVTAGLNYKFFSPSGVGSRISLESPLMLIGEATTSVSPRPGRRIGVAMPRWRTCGSANTWSIL